MKNGIGYGVTAGKSEIIGALDTSIIHERIQSKKRRVKYIGKELPLQIYEAVEVLVKGTPVYFLKGMSGSYPTADFEELA